MCKRIFKSQTTTSGDIPFYKIGTFGKIPNAFISNEIYQEYKRKFSFPKKGDILISASGTIGKTIKYDGKPAYFKDSNIVWIDNNEKKVLNDYLKLFYSVCNWQTTKGATISILCNDNLKNIPIPVPPLPEQKWIVAILDKAFAAIDKARANNAEQNLKNTKEIFESYSQNVYKTKVDGKQFEVLDSLCELIVDCEHKTAPTQETGYPSIRTPNIGKGELILENVNRVSYETYIKWTKRVIPKSGDLILAREAPAGNIAVIPENLEVCLGQRTVLIRPKKQKFIPKYLSYLILSKDVQRILLSHSTGATVQHINMKDIRAFKIYNLSDLKTQKAIVEKLDALSEKVKRSEEVYQRKVENLDELKKVILQKAFRGEV